MSACDSEKQDREEMRRSFWCRNVRASSLESGENEPKREREGERGQESVREWFFTPAQKNNKN